VSARTDLTVVLTFDVDGETLWTSRDANSRIGPVMLSQGAYGPLEGVPRILRLLRKHDLRATFFVTGYVVDHYPDRCRDIVAAGHEIAHHTYGHEWPSRVDAQSERRSFVRALQSIERLTGRKPAGYRAPGWELSDSTFGLVREFGIEYTSNMMDGEHPYELTVSGAPTGVIELPCSWVLDDAAFFMYGLTYDPPQFAPSQVYEQWMGEFEGMRAERDGRVYVLTLHPQIIGRASRMAMLDRLVAAMKRRGGVAFSTAGAAAAAARRSGETRTREYDGSRALLQAEGLHTERQ